MILKDTMNIKMLKAPLKERSRMRIAFIPLLKRE